MGGLGPGIGGFELVVIGLVAPACRGAKGFADPDASRRPDGGQGARHGQRVPHQFRRNGAAVRAGRPAQGGRGAADRAGGHVSSGAEADAAFKDINAGLNAPATPAVLSPPSAEQATEVPAMTPAADEWPDSGASDVPRPSPNPRVQRRKLPPRRAMRLRRRLRKLSRSPRRPSPARPRKPRRRRPRLRPPSPRLRARRLSTFDLFRP